MYGRLAQPAMATSIIVMRMYELCDAGSLSLRDPSSLSSCGASLLSSRRAKSVLSCSLSSCEACSSGAFVVR